MKTKAFYSPLASLVSFLAEKTPEPLGTEDFLSPTTSVQAVEPHLIALKSGIIMVRQCMTCQ